jgi:hypothetical protein
VEMAGVEVSGVDVSAMKVTGTDMAAIKVTNTDMAAIRMTDTDMAAIKVTCTDMAAIKVTSADMAATPMAATTVAATSVTATSVATTMPHLHGVGLSITAQQVCCRGFFPLFQIKLQRVVFGSGRSRPHPQDCGSYRSKHPATVIHMVALLGGEKSQLSPNLLLGSVVPLGN